MKSILIHQNVFESINLILNKIPVKSNECLETVICEVYKEGISVKKCGHSPFSGLLL